MAKRKRSLPTLWEVPDELWERIEPLLKRLDPPGRTGRRRVDRRRVLDGIIFHLRTGWRVPTRRHYIPHLRRRGEAPIPKSGRKYPARRWVVERTFAWLSKCRAILVRYDKKPEHYLGLLQFACALLWYRRLRLNQAHD